MVKRIEALTEEQRAQMPAWSERWVKTGLLTEPADRPKAEAAIRQCYEAAGIAGAATVPVIWVDDPLTMCLAGASAMHLLKKSELVQEVAQATLHLPNKVDTVKCFRRLTEDNLFWSVCRELKATELAADIYEGLKQSVKEALAQDDAQAKFDAVVNNIAHAINSRVSYWLAHNVRRHFEDGSPDAIDLNEVVQEALAQELTQACYNIVKNETSLSGVFTNRIAHDLVWSIRAKFAGQGFVGVGVREAAKQYLLDGEIERTLANQEPSAKGDDLDNLRASLIHLIAFTKVLGKGYQSGASLHNHTNLELGEQLSRKHHVVHLSSEVTDEIKRQVEELLANQQQPKPLADCKVNLYKAVFLKPGDLERLKLNVECTLREKAGPRVAQVGATGLLQDSTVPSLSYVLQNEVKELLANQQQPKPLAGYDKHNNFRPNELSDLQMEAHGTISEQISTDASFNAASLLNNLTASLIASALVAAAQASVRATPPTSLNSPSVVKAVSEVLTAVVQPKVDAAIAAKLNEVESLKIHSYILKSLVDKAIADAVFIELTDKLELKTLVKARVIHDVKEAVEEALNAKPLDEKFYNEAENIGLVLDEAMDPCKVSCPVEDIIKLKADLTRVNNAMYRAVESVLREVLNPTAVEDQLDTSSLNLEHHLDLQVEDEVDWEVDEAIRSKSVDANVFGSGVTITNAIHKGVHHALSSLVQEAKRKDLTEAHLHYLLHSVLGIRVAEEAHDDAEQVFADADMFTSSSRIIEEVGDKIKELLSKQPLNTDDARQIIYKLMPDVADAFGAQTEELSTWSAINNLAEQADLTGEHPTEDLIEAALKELVADPAALNVELNKLRHKLGIGLASNVDEPYVEADDGLDKGGADAPTLAASVLYEVIGQAVKAALSEELGDVSNTLHLANVLIDEKIYEQTAPDTHPPVTQDEIDIDRIETEIRSGIGKALAELLNNLPESLEGELNALEASVRSAVNLGSPYELNNRFIDLRSAADWYTHRLAAGWQTRQAVLDAVHTALTQADEDLVTAVRNNWSKYLWGQFDTGWQAFQSFFREVCGLEIEPRLEQAAAGYQAIAESCSWWYPTTHFCIACERPSVIHMRDRQLHCEDGPAIQYRNGWSLWFLEGIKVDEQIVMCPETQTLDQLHNEENEEVKRIRINRYGWAKYLVDAGASVIDVQTAPGGWREALMQTASHTVLCTYDPSTGRPYALEVAPTCTTCAEAQEYLLGTHTFTNLKIKPKSPYPVIRT